MKYEYGIAYNGSNETNIHRQGMTFEEALKWVDEWIEDGGKTGVFKIVKREISDWEVV